MSWPELYPSGPGTPPALTLRHLVLAALAEAFVTRRNTTHPFCADCMTEGATCPDHDRDLADAAAYEAACMRLAGIGSDGAMTALIGGLTS